MPLITSGILNSNWRAIRASVTRFARMCQWMVGGLLLVSRLHGVDQPPWLSKAEDLELAGHFIQASNVLAAALSTLPLSLEERHTAEFEIDRLERIRKDFPLTEEALYEALGRSVRGLLKAEFRQWLDEGRFDFRVIDGEVRYMGSSVSNLFFRHPELEGRRQPSKETAVLQIRKWETCRTIREAAKKHHSPYVLPKTFAVQMKVTAHAGATPASGVVRAWLPIPRGFPYQTGFQLLRASPAVKKIEPESSLIRSAYLEQLASPNQPVSFEIEYQYSTYGVYFDIDASAVTACDHSDPELKPYLGEGPHIRFTPEMRILSDQVAGNESNPGKKAKAFHDWIAENIKYSYAIEYSTIRNIGDYCRGRRYGDCGQEALLFITLCRLNGIPARWQSGWTTFPGSKSIHDWAEIYLAPYGWLPVDPYMGIFAMQYASGLSPAQRREVRDFYFGGLDQYRLSANSDHCQKLVPPREAFRSDTVDFQRGELECNGRNIYFDRFSYELTAKELTPRANLP